MITFDDSDDADLKDPTAALESDPITFDPDSTGEELYAAAFLGDNDLKDPAAIAEFEDTSRELTRIFLHDSNLTKAAEKIVQDLSKNILDGNMDNVQDLLAKLASDKGSIIPAMKLLEKLLITSPSDKLTWDSHTDKNGKVVLRLHLTHDYLPGDPNTGEFHVMIPSSGTPTGKVREHVNVQAIPMNPNQALILIGQHIQASRKPGPVKPEETDQRSQEK